MIEKEKKTIALVNTNLETIKLDVLKPTLGINVINVQELASKGYYTYDPGFTSTAACKSKITYIDGDQGILLHRGYPIDQLTTNSTYLEVCYILLYGEKPSQKNYDDFKKIILEHMILNDQIPQLLQAFQRNSHPMAILCGITGALAAFYNDLLDVNNPTHREMAAFRLLAKMPIIAAMCYKYSIGKPFIGPQNNMSYLANFLYMMFASPDIRYEINPVIEKAMDCIFILHADHEQNASTSTIRTVGSSGANPFACIAAGIASLWGPAHGGANEACLRMLEDIQTIDNIPKFIKRAKNKNDPFRLIGFGHRVYKNHDPRATVMKQTCDIVFKELKLNDNILEIAKQLEYVALNDPYFIEKKLYPNIDFYSGIILKAIGIPTTMFTVIFAIARTIGWLAHWNEMYNEELKIVRPRQLYIGYKKRDFYSNLIKK